MIRRSRQCLGLCAGLSGRRAALCESMVLALNDKKNDENDRSRTEGTEMIRANGRRVAAEDEYDHQQGHARDHGGGDCFIWAVGGSGGEPGRPWWW